MTQRILILGGSGRIGRSVAADLLAQTNAVMTLTGRRAQPSFTLAARQQYQSLHLADRPAVTAAIAAHDLIIHCAGPFRNRDLAVLDSCIAQRRPYVDVADSPDYVRQALTYRAAAQAAGIPCILGTGVFPGISNSLVRQGVEQLDQAEAAHLSYLVAGSGGAGVTVMRTTFIELQTPFQSKIDGRWQTIAPYSDREVLTFPAPYNTGAGVYWFNTVEALTLPQSFPQLQTIITKFGSLPDYYNRLTHAMTKLPKGWLLNPTVIEALSHISYAMTQVSDRISGTGIAMRFAISGRKANEPKTYLVTATHPDTAQIAGYGTGSVAQLLLAGELSKPGVWPVEQSVATAQFEQAMAQRGIGFNREMLRLY
ncbi:MAG: NAD-dependent epimerase/dehydratase family protein [Leptolyngbya sp. SIO4C1]|nr:NAD-dependent epimerase/dehydratase family protein [Leptolyngbya sp. SIO4C1]